MTTTAYLNSTVEICNQLSCSEILAVLLQEAKKVAGQTVPVPDTSEHDHTTGLLSTADTTWQLRSAFTIMTMQSGFALLETGCVSAKNIANIMVKNVVDVALGGLCYWMFGYGLTFGADEDYTFDNTTGTGSALNGSDLHFNIGSSKTSSIVNSSTLWDVSSFFGTKYFFINYPPSNQSGSLYTHYFFHFSFASTATTIVSGAVAERMRLTPYMIFAFFNTLSYCVPAAWIWSSRGFLKQLGFYDFAGVCGVHVNGGAAALVAAIILGSRRDRWSHPHLYDMTSPVTALTGTLMLWWSWFSFNCGSSGGVDGNLGNINALVAVNTLHGSIAGALISIWLSMMTFSGNVNVAHVINGILGGLVSITGCCSVIMPGEALIIGALGAFITIFCAYIVELVRIDDPVGAIAVHLGAGTWGTIATGLFGKNFHLASNADQMDRIDRGLLFGGGWKLLGVQTLGSLMIVIWSGLTTLIFLSVINQFSTIRMSPVEEKLGADLVEHGIYRQSDGELDSTNFEVVNPNKNDNQTSDDDTDDNVPRRRQTSKMSRLPQSNGANFGGLPSRATVDIESETERAAYDRAVARAKNISASSVDTLGRRKRSLRGLPYSETTTWPAPNQSLAKLKLVLQRMMPATLGGKQGSSSVGRVTPFLTRNSPVEYEGNSISEENKIQNRNKAAGKRRKECKGKRMNKATSNGKVPIWTVNGHPKNSRDNG